MSEHYSTVFDPKAIRAIAEKYGFCIIKDFYSLREINDFEVRLSKLPRLPDGSFPDLYSCKSLSHLMLDERVLQIATALLGDKLVYYRQSHIDFEEVPGRITNNPFRQFHCDAKGTSNSLLKFWNGAANEIYPGYRFAVYFRDYRNCSGGLKVGVGTHKRDFQQYFQYSSFKGIKTLPLAPHLIDELALKLPVAPFELHNLYSQPGDLVVFNLRVFHSAGAVRLKARPTLSLLPLIEETIERDFPELCLPIPDGSRNAIFFDYGAKSEAIDHYIKWRALHTVNSCSIELLNNKMHPSFEIRNDIPLFGLATEIERGLRALGVDVSADQTPSLKDISPRELIDIFSELCFGHTEYSDKHSFYDPQVLEEKLAADRDAAVIDMIRRIRLSLNAYRRATGKTGIA